MLKIIFFFRGYLKIKVCGIAPERFLNLCAVRNIMLWNITEEHDGYTMNITLKSFWTIRDIVRKTSTRVVVLKRTGLPFLIPRMKKSIILMIGILLFFIIFSISQLFLWQIKISGNVKITSEELHACIEKEGVHTYMLKKDVDITSLEKVLRNKFPEITWLSVYMSGNELHIEIKENDKIILPSAVEEETSKDICALIPGKVDYIVTRKGTPQVKKGMEVKKDDVLISSKVEIYDNEGNIKEIEYVSADADVIISGNIKKTFQTNIQKETIKETGNYKECSYIKMGEKYHLIQIFNQSFDSYEVKKIRNRELFTNNILPVEIGRLRICETIKEQNEKSQEECKDELMKQLDDYLVSLYEKGIQITGKNVRIVRCMDIVKMEVVLGAKGRFVYTRNGYFCEGSTGVVRDAGSVY